MMIRPTVWNEWQIGLYSFLDGCDVGKKGNSCEKKKIVTEKVHYLITQEVPCDVKCDSNV